MNHPPPSHPQSGPDQPSERSPSSAPLPAPPASSRWQRLLLLVLLLLALMMGSFGQFMFTQTSTRTDPFPWIALGSLVAAMVAFALAVAGMERDETNHRDFWERVLSLVAHPPWRTVLVLLALAQTLLLLVLLGSPELASYNWTALVWIGAIACYLVAIAAGRNQSAPTPATPYPPPQTHQSSARFGQRRTVLLVLGIVLVALGLRLFSLGTLPPTLGGDEGSQGVEAMRVLDGEIVNPFGTGWLGVPTMSFYFNAITIGLLGNTMFALRLPWALVGTATVLITYLLVRRLKGQTLALMTAALLATYHYHIHFSRLGSNQVADTFFVSLALLLFYRGYDSARFSRAGVYLNWALCGVVVGVAQYFYAGARFTAVLITAMLLYFLVRDGVRFWQMRYREILVLVGAALISAAPMIQYALRFPDDYNARVNQVGIIQSGWLEQEQAARGEGPLPILLEQVRRAALAFNFYEDRTFWYGLHEPLFDFSAGVLFALGLGYATFNLLDRRLAPMVAWWWGAMLMGGALTENPPSSMRLITLSIPAVFFVALALLRMVQTVQYGVAWRWFERRAAQVLVLGVVLLSLSSIRAYFLDYTPQRIYGNPNAVVATALGTYARDHLGPEWRIYFFGHPRMYVGFGSIPYLAPEVEGLDMYNVLQTPPERSLIPADKHAAFVFLPERRGELEMVRTTFPDGEVREIPSPLHEGSLFTMYFVYRSELGG